MNPSLPTIYNSRFLKADRRTGIKAKGSHTYRTTLERQTRLDDTFILPGAALRVDAAGPADQVLVLPIAGGALLTTAQESERPLVPGCIYSVPALAGSSFTLTNPFEQETVNLLLVWVPVPTAASAAVQEFKLPLVEKNILVAPEDPVLPVRVGLYDSRVKGHIPAITPGGFSLCYVINGSFEIEDRLVEHRDTLLLWETPALDFEALSEMAILFYLECSSIY